jgi:hypothetical protein
MHHAWFIIGLLLALIRPPLRTLLRRRSRRNARGPWYIVHRCGRLADSVTNDLSDKRFSLTHVEHSIILVAFSNIVSSSNHHNNFSKTSQSQLAGVVLAVRYLLTLPGPPILTSSL